MIFALLTLLSGLSLSAIAEYFSVIGLLAIFPMAFWPILLLGISAGVAKIVAATWLKREWNNSPIVIKTYLFISIIILMIITSIGSYGFLSKAHLEQGASTVDNSAKIERLDQEISRERSTIADDEKLISQLDSTINSYLGKDRTDKSVSIRRSQAPQRKQLRDDINTSQKKIDDYSDQKLSLQSEVRKLELDTGPIRYIAELFYGTDSNSTKNIEAAVRIFSLIIVLTLDPLAVILTVAANHTFLRLQNEKNQKVKEEEHTRQNVRGAAETKQPLDNQQNTNEVFQKTDTSEKLSKDYDRTKYTILEPAKIHSEILQKSLDLLNEDEETTTHSIESKNGILPYDSERNIPTLDDTTSFGNKNATTPTDSQEITETQALEEAPLTNVTLLIHDNNIIEDSQEIELSKNDISERGPWAAQASTLRGLIGNSLHFVPKKINEEEKYKIKISSANEDEVDKGHATSPITPSVQLQRQEKEMPQKFIANSIRNTISEKSINSEKVTIPTPLSWLNEFKRI